MDFKIEELLAIPMVPSIRIKYGPGPDDAVEIDQAAWEANKDRFIQFCLSIPDVGGSSWRALKAHTGQNGLMAKVLIALGDMAGVWKMHPPTNVDDYWVLWQNPIYPMILGGTVNVLQATPTKPSQGSLEKGTKTCWCCGQLMGAPDSLVHELQESEQEDVCQECHDAGCGDPDLPCLVDAAKAPAKVKVAAAEPVEGAEQPDPEAIARYLAQFNQD